jgi:type II restriction enzyme
VLAGNADSVLQELRDKAAKAARKRHQEAMEDVREATEHTQAQHVLIRIGRALGYDVFVARNDRNRTCGGDSFASLTIPHFPSLGLPADVQQTVELIDVLWFAKGSAQPVCAFEVEQSTSIYSGILRMKDLAMSVRDQQCHFYLVAPEAREQEVVAQILRPGLRGGEDVFRLGYLPAGELKEQCEALCRFGVDRSVLLKLARAHNWRESRLRARRSLLSIPLKSDSIRDLPTVVCLHRRRLRRHTIRDIHPAACQRLVQRDVLQQHAGL